MSPYLIALRARLYSLSPAGAHRDANPAFVHIALDAAQTTVAVEEIRVGAALAVRAVVAGEEDERLVVNAEFLEQRHQTPDVAIHSRDHRGLGLFLIGP